ncbi:MAG: peptidylprolyl isomerase [Candidatus Woesearchaeota archaeon]
MGVEVGDKIEVRYTGWKKSTGEVFESNEDNRQPPFTMTVGSREVIEGLSKGVLDMNEGETKKFEVPYTEAYGRKRQELIQAIPRVQLMGKVEPKVGKVLMLKSEKGSIFPAMITEVDHDRVILNMNPPLAGEDLIFQVKVERIISKSGKR